MRLEVNGAGLSFKSLLKMNFFGHMIGGLIVAIPFVAADLLRSEDPLKSSLYLYCDTATFLFFVLMISIFPVALDKMEIH